MNKPGSGLFGLVPFLFLTTMLAASLVVSGCAARHERGSASHGGSWSSLVESDSGIERAPSPGESDAEPPAGHGVAASPPAERQGRLLVDFITEPARVGLEGRASDTRAAVDKPRVQEGEVAGASSPEPEAERSRILSGSGDVTTIEGFRVQILAVQSYESARAVVDKARADLDEPVYLDFIDPYYKIRVGDYESRSVAVGVAARLAEAGYEDAWVARTEINIVERHAP